MYYVRKTKTASGATAVQVVRYQERRTIICFHVGSSHDKEKVALLEQEARKWIENVTGQESLFLPFEKEKQKETILVVSKSQYMGVKYTFLYEVLSRQLVFFSFHALENQLLFDLVLMRIVQPLSKLSSLKRLSSMFGITYQRGHLYEALAAMSSYKERVLETVVQFAQERYSFDFSMVFYDVTTLYYESFTEDEDTVDTKGNVIAKGLRRDGFSKDLKFNQPQIVIGLIVNNDGFPVSYEVFEGNTFEGDTFIPVISAFKKKYGVESLTVVADAAMISFDNVEKLKEHQLSYIVGGRIANLKRDEMKEVSTALIGETQDEKELVKKDRTSTRIETEKGLLICDFSLKRYLKDKREMEKQIQRAELLLKKHEGIKRAKFLTSKGKKKAEQVLNTALIERTKRLLGIKGYYTNLRKEADKTIIDQYHSLWHVEQAFRIAKSDLAARPIYHFKRQTIEAHMLICFMALAVAKHMELKTKKSIKQIVQLLQSITEARIRNKFTGEVVVFREELSDEVEQLWKTLAKP